MSSSAKQAPSAPPFREDIRLMRAFAVTAVLAFHFGVPGFGGGFAGVDVFFVISGYLMTCILCGESPPGYAAFIGARARRIVPALIAMCFACLAAGYVLCDAADYRMNARHLLHALTFTSNFAFKDEDGYFDSPSQTKWLLHTWSLAAEWQFYVVYPFLLKGFEAAGRRLKIGLLPARMAGCFVTIVLSLAMAAWLRESDPAGAFFMLPARAWELLAGAIAALAPCAIPQQGRSLLGTLSWAGMAACIFGLNETMSWPASWALAPVCCTALAVWAAPPLSARSSLRPAGWLGDISYSLYLWHWPVYCALALATVSGAVRGTAALIISVGAACFSYAWAERPARRAGAKRIHAAWAVTAALTAAAAAVIVMLNGVPARLPASVLQAEAGAADHIPRAAFVCGAGALKGKPASCVIGGVADRSPRLFLWGDSHAESVAEAVAGARLGGAYTQLRQCPSLPETELLSNAGKVRCAEVNHAVMAQIHALPSDVALVILNRYSLHLVGPNEGGSKPWGFRYTDMTTQPATPEARARAYVDRFTKTMCAFAKERRTVVIGPVPEIGQDVPRVLARARMAGAPDPDLDVSVAEYHSRHAAILEALRRVSACGVIVVDAESVFCPDGRCRAVAADGFPLYFDDDHVNRHGAALLKGELKRALGE